MDSKTPDFQASAGKARQRVKKAILILTISGVLLSVCGALYGFSSTLQSHIRFGLSSLSHRIEEKLHNFHLLSLIAPYVKAWNQVQLKVSQIQKLDVENHELRLQNANLKLQVVTRNFDQQSKEGEKVTRQKEFKLSQETGSILGRTLASISFQVPEKMDQDQLYTLAVGYFKTGENEKAAVILSHLLSENRPVGGNKTPYRTAKNILMTGIAWYHVENFALADSYFNEVLRNSDSSSEPKGEGNNDPNSRYLAQARLWKALIAEKTGKKTKSQFWMRDLLDHHPRSSEVEWINGKSHATQ